LTKNVVPSNGGWPNCGLPDVALTVRAARCYIFSSQKIPILVSYGGPWNGKGGYLEHITAIWYILWSFGILVTIRSIFPRFWYFGVEKNLATLLTVTTE
jgi:hypothetical protein